MPRRPELTARVVPTPCLLCPDDAKQEATEWHHLREVTFGGPQDGQTVPLCGTCHNRVHRLATAIEKGKTIISALPAHPPWQTVLATLLDNRQRFRNSGRAATDARRRVSFEQTVEEWQMAHYVKTAMGASSLEAMMKTLIRRAAEYYRRGGS